MSQIKDPLLTNPSLSYSVPAPNQSRGSQENWAVKHPVAALLLGEASSPLVLVSSHDVVFSLPTVSTGAGLD